MYADTLHAVRGTVEHRSMFGTFLLEVRTCEIGVGCSSSLRPNGCKLLSRIARGLVRLLPVLVADGDE